MNRALETVVICAAAAFVEACGGGDEASGPVTDGQGTPDAMVNPQALSADASTTSESDAAQAMGAKGRRYSFFEIGTLGRRRHTYTFTDIGINAGPLPAINNFGQVAWTSRTGAQSRQATFWDGSTSIALGTLGGTSSVAGGINDSAQVVGQSFTTTTSNHYHATLWNGTTAIDLGALGGTNRNSYAYGINNSGQVVGYSDPDGIYRPTLWTGTAATDLGALGGPNFWGIARAINNAGQAVGGSFLHGDLDERATLWNGTAATDLGTLGGSFSAAFAINDAGQIVGWSHTAGDAAMHATLWNGTTTTDLGALGGTTSLAFSINRTGQVVGYSVSASGSYRATLWDGTAGIDLNIFLDARTVRAGWSLIAASGINDHGSIVGTAQNTSTDEIHVFLLKPLTDKEQCKKGGWQNFGFPNQGQCIQFANTAGK
jgi:probable HAF family extracellular repeat protein